MTGKNTAAHYDIIIVGAGPAGANLARLVDARRYRVLLIDGSDERDKVCGGLISPDAQDILARYDISLPRDILVSPQLFSVRTIDLADGRTRYYRRIYMNVDRRRFDEFFRGLVPDTVEIVKGRCEGISRIDGGYALDVAGRRVTCRYLIGADGAGSVVRRSLFADRSLQRYVALQQWFRAGETDPYYSCLFDNETSEGCSWIFFKDGMLIFGGAFGIRGGREAFEVQKRKLVKLGIVDEHIFAAPQKLEACTVARPRMRRGIFLGEGGAFLIGEAAGLISPSSFEGISYALASAEALADAFRLGRDGGSVAKCYRRGARKLVRKIRLKCLKRPFMYNQTLRSLVMRSGITSIRIRKGDPS